jgi:hypothetical protein
MGIDFLCSPLDVGVHHGMVDKHWVDYLELANGGKVPNPAEVMVPYGVTAGEMENSTAWCYTYDSSHLPEEVNPKRPSGIPDSWLKMTLGENVTSAVINTIKNATSNVFVKVEDQIRRNDTADLHFKKQGKSSANTSWRASRVDFTWILSGFIALLFNV